MDHIVSRMKLAELKQGNLGKAYQQLESQASELLLFSLQWKDLEEHYDSTHKVMRSFAEELEARDRVVSSKEEQIVSLHNSISDCSVELALKERELGVTKSLVEKYDEEVTLKDKELVLAKEKVCGVLEEIKLKERDLNMTSMKIDDYEKEIEVKENVICMINKRIEDSEKEMELKEKILARIAESINDCSNDLTQKERQVVSVKILIEEHNEELQFKEKLYDNIGKQIKELSKELKSKEMELDSIESKIAAAWKEKILDFIDTNTKKCRKELDSKDKELQLLDGKLKKYTEETKIKEINLNIMQNRIEEQNIELDIKEEQLQSTQSLLKDCEKEIELIREQLALIQNTVLESSSTDSAKESVHEYASDLGFKDKKNNSIQEMAKKCLHDLQLKEKHYGALKLSVEDQLQKLETKEQEFKRQSDDLAEKQRVINSLFELLNKRLADESMVTNFKLLKDSKDEYCKILLEKETQFKNEVTELEEKEKNDYETKDGDELMRLLCEHLKMHDSIRIEVANALRTSSFPAKMVLDAMRWFYLSDVRTGDMRYDKHLVKRSSFILLAELMRIPTQITAPVKTEALKMANEWKAQMKSTNKNSLEVLVFLHLLANYGLASSFSLEELQSLLNSLSDKKQAACLQQIMGITAVSTMSPTFHSVKMEQLEALQANTSFDSEFSRKESITKSRHGLTPHEISATLQMSMDPANLVLDVFQGYISLQWRKEESDIEECVARSYMLEQLSKTSPNIDPEVKKVAMKLAVEWSTNMESQHEDSLVSFLRFLATYGLISSFKKEKILKFFEVVVLHKQAPELFQLLGFTQHIFADLIRDLISSHQVLKAIEITYAFKLVDKFQPVRILKDYVMSARNFTRRQRRKKHSAEGRAAVLDKEITVLMDVIQCITDHNLKSEFPTQNLQTRIIFLQKMKGNPSYFEKDPSTETALTEQNGEKPASDTHVTKSEIVAHPTKSEEKKQPEMGPKIVHSTNNAPDEQAASDTHVTKSPIVAHPTKSVEKKQPEMGPKIVHSTNNAPYEQSASDTHVTKSQIVAPPTKSEEKKQPEMGPKIVHSTNNAPYEQGMNKRQRTIDQPATYPELPQARVGNLIPWQIENRQVSYERQGPFNSDGFNVGAGNNFRGPQHPYPPDSWYRPM